MEQLPGTAARLSSTSPCFFNMKGDDGVEARGGRSGSVGVRQGGVPVLDFFVFSYFRVFVIDLEELPSAITSSRFPRLSQRNGPPRRLAPQLQRLDACREANCGRMRSNRSRKHESTKTRKRARWRRSLARGGFLSSSIETPRSDARSIDVNLTFQTSYD